MRFLTTAIVLGPFILAGALPALAGQSHLRGSDSTIQLAASDDAAADRATYSQRARDETLGWQRKLHDFGEAAEAKGKSVGNAAENDLNKAWTRTSDASTALQAAGAEGWEDAKTSFEKASHELAEAWHKVHPEDR